MELYYNGDRRLDISIPVPPVDGTLGVFIKDSEGEVLKEIQTVVVDPDTGGYYITVPYSILASRTPFYLDVVFTYLEDGIPTQYHNNKRVEVVFPLVSVNEVREELELDPLEADDDKIRRAERRARVMIENATGQVFAPSREILDAQISSNGSLRLPKKLNSLISVDGLNAPSYYVIDPTGFRLAVKYPRKRNDIRASGFPISPPNYRTIGVTPVKVLGNWGYETVPTDIKEAALLLIEQALCSDSLYRERYLQSMTAADWRIEFNSQAYAGTGNAIADKILAKYQVSHMAVV